MGQLIVEERTCGCFSQQRRLRRLISAQETEPAFATQHTAIRAVAVSPDGKLLALGDSSGNVSVWELR